MEKLVQSLCDVFYDYHSFDDFEFNVEHVLKWVKQFEKNEQRFLIEELLYLSTQDIYISEKKGRAILINKIKALSVYYKFKNPVSFLQNVDFLKMQDEQKSQSILLAILDEELQNNFKISLNDCGLKSDTHAIYIDDILANAGTLFSHCVEWLKIINKDGNSNFDKVITDEKKFIISVFCKHTWGQDNLKWRLKYEFKKDAIMDKVKFQAPYNVENHPSWPNQKYNFAYPIHDKQPELVMDYFNNLEAERKAEFAFRRANAPIKEEFFSSPANRIRFENVILNKGIELLNHAKHLKPNHRPLGITNPSKKILGTGTLFFTWRNISNTTPIVFWWLPNWYPLFPVYNRGN